MGHKQFDRIWDCLFAGSSVRDGRALIGTRIIDDRKHHPSSWNLRSSYLTRITIPHICLYLESILVTPITITY